MTQALLEMGDRVAALDLSLENLDQSYPNLLCQVCDVTDPALVQSAVDEVIRRWGGVDVLVNNACLALFKLFAERSIAEIRAEFEVNYFGYLNMISAVLPVMCKQGHGVIHNVSSGVGYTGMPGMTGYTSTKGAIESLPRTLALEYTAGGIVFNVMHPPLTRTKSSSGLGVPAPMMADPMAVGRGLARQVGKTAAVLTQNFSNGFQTWASYHFRVRMGKLLVMMTERAKRAEKA
jgi:NAD(P)-dependent dehydrogenase (short-subunit alcohol dehydrogenase family)